MSQRGEVGKKVRMKTANKAKNKSVDDDRRWRDERRTTG